MTALYNDTMTSVNAGTSGRNSVEAKWHSRVRVQAGDYEADAKPKGDTIAIGQIPEGSMLLPESVVLFDALGANSALAVGTTASPALYKASTATTSAGSMNLDAIGGANSPVSADTDILITVSGTGAITGTIKSVLVYAWV